MRATRRKRMTIIIGVIAAVLIILNGVLYFANDYFIKEKDEIRISSLQLETQIAKTIERNNFLNATEREPFEKLQGYIPATPRFEEFINDYILPLKESVGIEFDSIRFNQEGIEATASEAALFGQYNVNKFEVTFEGVGDSEAAITDFIEELLDLDRTIIITDYILNTRDTSISYNLTIQMYYLIDDKYKDQLSGLEAGSGDYNNYLTE